MATGLARRLCLCLLTREGSLLEPLAPWPPWALERISSSSWAHPDLTRRNLPWHFLARLLWPTSRRSGPLVGAPKAAAYSSPEAVVRSPTLSRRVSWPGMAADLCHFSIASSYSGTHGLPRHHGAKGIHTISFTGLRARYGTQPGIVP